MIDVNLGHSIVDVLEDFVKQEQSIVDFLRGGKYVFGDIMLSNAPDFSKGAISAHEQVIHGLEKYYLNPLREQVRAMAKHAKLADEIFSKIPKVD